MIVSHIKKFSSLVVVMNIFFLSSCVDLHGDWWNNDYATNEDTWINSKVDSATANKIKVQCSDIAVETVMGVKNFSKLSDSKSNEIIKKQTQSIQLSNEITKKMEECKLKNGFQFYPRGIKNNHPTICIGDYKKMPGCISAGY